MTIFINHYTSYHVIHSFVYNNNQILIFTLLSSQTNVILFYLYVNMNIENRIKSIIKLSSTYTVHPFSSPSDVRKLILGNTTFVNDDFINACKDNNLLLARVLLIQDTLVPNYYDSMCFAIKHKNIKIVKLLLEDGRTKVGYDGFRMIIQYEDNKENYDLYIMLFKQLPILDVNGGNYRLDILYVMMERNSFKNWNMSIFKHTLNTLKTLYSNEMGIGSTRILKIMINVLISGSFEIVLMYFKVYYNLQVLLSFIGATVENGLLDEFNFLLEYDTNNECIYDMKQDIHRLLNISTTYSRPQFVKLFLSLIKDDNLLQNQLSFDVKNSHFNNRFIKDIEDDTIACIEAYISDGRLNVCSEINNSNLTLKFAKRKMFHVFNYLLPYTDSKFGKEITERFCSHKSSYKLLDRMFMSMKDIHTKFNNSTILLNFLESTRDVVSIDDRYLFNKYHGTLKRLIKTNQFDSVNINNKLLKVVEKYNLSKNIS